MATITPIDESAAVPNAGPKITPIEDDSPQSLQDARGKVGALNAEMGMVAGPLAHSALKGMTAGWVDELTADEYAAVIGAENAYRKMTGKPVPYGIGEAREMMLRAQRETEKEFHNRHPYLDTGAELAGGMAMPGLGAASKFIKGADLAKDATLGEKLTNFAGQTSRAAGVGGVIGGVAGASDESDRLGGATRGAETGIALAGGLHMIGAAGASGLPKVAPFISENLLEAWRTIRRAFGADLSDLNADKLTPEQLTQKNKAALEYIHKVAQAAGKSSQDLRTNAIEAEGKPITAAEGLGRSGVTQLGAIGRRTGLTGDKLESFLRQRAQSGPGRVLDDLEKVTGVDPATIDGNFNEQLKELQKKAKPLYDVAYEKEMTPDQHAEMAKFDSRPAVKAAKYWAYKLMAERGEKPERVGLVPKEGKVPIGLVGRQEMFEVEAREHKVETYREIVRGLDTVLQKSRDANGQLNTEDPDVDAIKNTRREYAEKLYDLVPELKIAQAAGGEVPRQVEAYTAAKRMMSPNVTMQKFKDRLAKFTPAQREALKGGVISDTYNRANFSTSVAGRLHLQDMQAPGFRDKLELVLGKDQATAFLRLTDQEMQLNRTGARMTPGVGSPTMEFQAAEVEREQAQAALARAGQSALSGRWMRSIGHLIHGPVDVGRTIGVDDVAVRNEVGRLLMLKPSELAQALENQPAGSVKLPEQKAAQFVRKLTENPKAIDAARRLTYSTINEVAQPKRQKVESVPGMEYLTGGP